MTAARAVWRKLRRPANLAALALFVLLLAAGRLLYRDFGVSWDEPTQLRIGIATYRYITQSDPALLSMRDRYYGPLFELILVRFQARSGDQAIYFSRHWLTFLGFFAGCVGFYLLARRFSRSGWSAAAACLMLILSPRIFADAFYNSKDIPFLAAYIWALLALLWFLDAPGPTRALAHGLATAALIAIRMPGMMLPALTVAGLGLELLARRLSWRRAGLCFALYLAVSASLCALFQPAYWPNPLDGFYQAWQLMSHFPHLTGMLYLGQTISSYALPWHYIPVWIGVTTPLFILAACLGGLAAVLADQARAVRTGLDCLNRDRLLILLAWLLPLAAVIALKSVLYDAWRQMFFIYPAILLAGQRGLQAVWVWLSAHLRPRVASGLAAAIFVAGLLPTLLWMSVNHPYANVYFNRLAGPDLSAAQQEFMLDYWGLAYRAGLEFLTRYQPEGPINVHFETMAGEASLPILNPDDSQRVSAIKELEGADYFIGNYYLKPSGYALAREIYTVKAGGASILSVYDLRPAP